MAGRGVEDPVVHLCDRYSRNAARRGLAPALLWRGPEGWRQRSWREERELVADVALGLAGLGLGPGDAVVVGLRDRPEAGVAEGAALHLAVAPVALEPGATPERVRAVARGSRAKVAILDDPEALRPWDQVRGDLPDLATVVLLDDPHDHLHLDWVGSWENLLAAGRSRRAADPIDFDARWARVRPDHPALLVLPEGGPPRGLELTHRDVAATEDGVGAALRLDRPQVGACLGAVPVVTRRLAGRWLPLRTGGCGALVADERDLPAIRPTVLAADAARWEGLAGDLAAAAAALPPTRRRLVRRGQEAVRAAAALRRDGAIPPLGLRLQRAALERVALRGVRAEVGLERCGLGLVAPDPLDPVVRDALEGFGIPVVRVREPGGAEVPPAGIEPARRL